MCYTCRSFRVVPSGRKISHTQEEGAAKAAAEAKAKKAHEAAAAAWAKVAAFWSPEGRGKNVNYYADAQNAAYEHHKRAGKNVDAGLLRTRRPTR